MLIKIAITLNLHFKTVLFLNMLTTKLLSLQVKMLKLHVVLHYLIILNQFYNLLPSHLYLLQKLHFLLRFLCLFHLLNFDHLLCWKSKFLFFDRLIVSDKLRMQIPDNLNAKLVHKLLKQLPEGQHCIYFHRLNFSINLQSEILMMDIQKICFLSVEGSQLFEFYISYWDSHSRSDHIMYLKVPKFMNMINNKNMYSD